MIVLDCPKCGSLLKREGLKHICPNCDYSKYGMRHYYKTQFARCPNCGCISSWRRDLGMYKCIYCGRIFNGRSNRL